MDLMVDSGAVRANRVRTSNQTFDGAFAGQTLPTSQKIFDFLDDNMTALQSKDKNFIHNQTVSSNIWTINHNLEKKPVPEIFLLRGEVFIKTLADYEHLSENSLRIYFTASETGRAIIN